MIDLANPAGLQQFLSHLKYTAKPRLKRTASMSVPPAALRPRGHSGSSRPNPGRSSRLTSLISCPNVACIYAVIVSPLLLFATLAQEGETRAENKFFWPAMATVAFILAIRNFSRSGSISLPPHIVCLIVYLGFAGMSVLWAFSPELSFVRFVQQSMIITTIVLPTITAVRPTDFMRGLFLTFAFAAILNIPFVIQGYQTIADNVAIGYSGYFLGKNYLGECAAIALLLSLHQLFYRGSRQLVRNLSCSHLHFTPTLRKLQNCDWSCCSCAIPRWGFIADQ